jgi:hypothetical protein
MFALFEKNKLYNFWENKVGDVFIENTCNSLDLNPADVELVKYYGLNNPPEHFNFDENKNLIILKKIVSETIEQETVMNNDGTQVVDEGGDPVFKTVTKEEISYEHDTTIEGVIFFDNGLMVKPC